MRHALLCLLLSLTQAPAMAAAAAHVTLQPLARITNDRNADLQRLEVLLEAGQVVGLRFDTINGENPHASDFSLADMQAGVVLDGDAQHEAIILRGSIDSRVGDSQLLISYLSNGLFGRHKACRAGMERDASGQWHIVNIYDHQWVAQLVVRTWSLGISTIEGICPR